MVELMISCGRADNVIAALKVLVLDWLKGRANDEVCASMAGALDSHLELAAQQVNAFFRGPVVSMMYSRWLGPQVARDRDELLHLSEVPSADKLDGDKQDKYRAVTKNFQRVRYSRFIVSVGVFNLLRLSGCQSCSAHVAQCFRPMHTASVEASESFDA